MIEAKQKVKFINKDRTDFFKVLKERVDNYFAENKISPHANARMIFKTVFMLSLYFIPFVLILTGVASGIAFWLCWVLAGFGLAGIGMSVMHDANHGAYSSSKKINSIIGFVLNIVGGDATNWKVQHNILHHTYTNIAGIDEDIKDRAGMRFNPSGKFRKQQRYQVVYAMFLYSLMSLYWVTLKDFFQYVRYKHEGRLNDLHHDRRRKFAVMILFKIIYYFYAIALPIILFPAIWWKVVLGFIVLHLVSGLVLSFVFQLAHVVESTTFPLPDKNGNIESEWAIHQLQTTADFAPKNKLITFYVGGLNYQAIHHLFPRICHVHYPKLAPIVEKTAKEFGLQYLSYKTFGAALRSHLRLLNKLGRKEIQHMAVEM